MTLLSLLVNEVSDEVAKGLKISAVFFVESFSESAVAEEEKILPTVAWAPPFTVSALLEKGLEIVDGVVDEDAAKGLEIVAEELLVSEVAPNVNAGFSPVITGAFVFNSEDSESALGASPLIEPLGIDGNEKGAGDTAVVDELLIEPNTGGATDEGFVSMAEEGNDNDEALEKGFDDGKFVGAGFAVLEVPKDPENSEDVGANPGNLGNSAVNFSLVLLSWSSSPIALFFFIDSSLSASVLEGLEEFDSDALKEKATEVLVLSSGAVVAEGAPNEREGAPEEPDELPKAVVASLDVPGLSSIL